MAASKGFEPLMLIYSSVNLIFHMPALEAGAISHLCQLAIISLIRKTHLSGRVGVIKDFYSVWRWWYPLSSAAALLLLL